MRDTAWLVVPVTTAVGVERRAAGEGEAFASERAAHEFAATLTAAAEVIACRARCSICNSGGADFGDWRCATLAALRRISATKPFSGQRPDHGPG